MATSALKPNSNGRASKPRCLRVCATRALLASWAQVQTVTISLSFGRRAISPSVDPGGIRTESFGLILLSS